MGVYLVTGISGSGKTTVGRELARRGFEAIDADSRLAEWVDRDGRAAPRPDDAGDDWLDGHEWTWKTERLEAFLDSPSSRPRFVCGNAHNESDFYHRFDTVFLLDIDAETMLRRLEDPSRDHDFGRSPEELRVLLEWLPDIRDRPSAHGAVVIDATRRLSEVVDAIVSHVCSTSFRG